MLQSAATDRATSAEFAIPLPAHNALYSADDGDEVSLFAKELDSFDDDDATLDAIFAELGKADSLNEELVNAQ